MPIATLWYVLGDPTFVVVDHRSVMRQKDLHPAVVGSVDEAIEAILK